MISSMTFAKYFILVRHCSNVFPVAPTSIILAYFPVCWLYLEVVNMMGLNSPGYNSSAFSCTFMANFKF